MTQRKGYESLKPYYKRILSGETVDLKAVAPKLGVSYGHALKMFSVYIAEQKEEYRNLERF